MAKERGIGLVSKLDFGPEYREDGGTTAPVETGRFKYFSEVAKRRNSPLLIANLMFIITLIPLFVLLVLIEVFGGLEGLAEKFTGIKDPYLLGNVGMGFSQTEHSVLEIKLNMLNVYYVIFAIIGVIAIPVSVGFGGMLHLSGKFIIGDSFISKKDKFGNDVPRAIKEYFKGIKRTWKEMLIVGAILCVLIAGVINLYIYFVGLFWQKQANAGHWIMIIFAGLAAIYMLMFLIHFMPSVVIYDMPIKSKMKNSAIFSIQFFIQTFGLVVILCAPIVLAFVLNLVTSMIVSVIIIAILLVYGSKWYSLILCNYQQYLSEKIISPVYNARAGKSQRKKKNKNKNNKK